MSTSKSALPFSKAIRAGDFLYLSGELGVLPEGMDPHAEGMDAAATMVMDALGRTLTAHGASWSNVVKCCVMLNDFSTWSRFNAVYVQYFDGTLPARSAFGANGLARGALLEMDCVAYLPAS